MHRSIRLHLVLVASLLGACGSDPAAPPPPAVDPSRSTLEATPGGAVADGADPVTLTATARDAGGAAIGGRVATFTVTGSDNTLSAASATTDAAGVASVTLTSTRAEPKTASVVIDGVPIRQQATADFGPGAAASLSLAGVPASPTAGVASAVTVTVLDAHGNVATGYRGTLHATSTDPAAQLPADLTFAAADAGQRTFPVAWRTAGTMSLTLAAADDAALTVTASSGVLPAPAFRLVFTSQPVGATAGILLSPAVRVSVLDTWGNLVTSGSPSVTLQLQGGTPGALLSGGGANPASSGTSEFVALSVNAAGGSYRLAATADGLLGAVSEPFAITAATPDASASSVAALPSSLQVGATATLTAVLRDLFGNPIPGVIVSFESTGTDITLTQPAVATDAAGMTAGALSSTAAGPITVTALAGTLTLEPQPVVTFEPGPASASRSTAVAAPASLVADGAASATLTVTLHDEWGNPAPGQWVTLSSSRGTADLLSSSWQATDAAGTATFTIRSEVAGASALTAVVTSTPAPVALTASVTFVPGPASAARSAVVASPATIAADGTSPVTVTVTLVDAKGNPVSGKEIALVSDRGADDTVAPASATSDGAGVALFSVTSLKFGTATLLATDTTDSLPLTQTAQVSFDGNVSPSRSTLSASATTLFADGASSATLTVKVVDAFGNPVVGEEVLLSSDRGSLDTVAPSTATTDVAGQVTFTVSSRNFGVATFSATATSYGVTLTPTAAVTFLSYLVFASPPSDVVAGAPFSPTLAVAARDAAGNSDAAFSSAISVALGSSPTGASLQGTLTSTPAGGVATFDDLRLEKAGGVYTLIATTTAPGIPAITSAPFVVEAAPPSRLEFLVQPAASGAGIHAPILVGLRDPFGNAPPLDGLELTVSLGENPTSASLGGTLTSTTVHGVATFEGLTVSLPGAGYTLVATDIPGSLTPATSLPFDVATPGLIGDGTAASCTEATLDAALATGGHFHFDCGPDPITITLTRTKSIASDVGLDGGGLVTLSGAGARQLFSVPPGRTVALENLTLTAGATGASGGAIYSAGRLSLVACKVSGSYAASSWGWAGSAGNGGAIHNDGGTLVLSGSTFTGNWTGGDGNYGGTYGNGGAIFTSGGTMVAAGSTFSANSAGNGWPYGGTVANGGAIFHTGGTLRVTGSTFSGDTASANVNGGLQANGGAIFSAGESLFVAGSTFSSNTAHGQYSYGGTFGDGGAIHLAAGTAAVLRSTFSGNVASSNWSYMANAGNGGAIYVAGGVLAAANSTFSGNSAGGAYPQSSTTGNGGAIFNAAGRLELVNATLADNAAGVNWSWSSTCGLGTAVYGGAALTNTMLRGAGACSGTFADGGHNLDSSGSCGVGPATDPLLSTAGLAGNGGPTQTIALQDGSPAIGAGDAAACAAAPILGVDQRGYARPGGGATSCSIGAFEHGAVP